MDNVVQMPASAAGLKGAQPVPVTTEIVDANSIATRELAPEIKALATTAEAALVRCDHATKIWTHSRSGMMLRNMTIGGEHSPMRRMRQVAAELQRKQQAMVEAKYKVLKRKLEARMKREEAESAPPEGLTQAMLILEAEELEAMASMVEQPYIGAMREVVELGHLHDALEKQIRAKYGRLDEEIFEQEEAHYWVRRGFAQSLRDMRQSGVIGAGNQELLEQIGLDPLVIQKILKEYLEGSRGTSNPNSKRLEDFLDKCAETYSQAAGERVKRLGLPQETHSDHLMLETTKEEDATT